VEHAAVVAAIRSLAPASGRLFGVIDGARCIDLAYEAKLRFGKEIRKLFLPEVQTQLWHVAPYLVPIDPASEYVDSWAKRWGTAAGVLLTSMGEEEALAAHLRKIFVVEDEEKQEYFFRFYDPRVLRTFLPTCSAEQLEEFFGPIANVILESDRGDVLIQSRGERGALASRSVAPGQIARDAAHIGVE
jgi:hypothetical protein